MHKEHKMENTSIVEIERLWIVKCQYRTHDKEYNDALYKFKADREYLPGEHVVVKDKFGLSLVKVVESEDVAFYRESWTASVVDLAQVNETVRAEHRKAKIAEQIREAVIRNIENNAFESLAKQYPEMAPMIEEYKASGGSYSDIMPSIVNMLK